MKSSDQINEVATALCKCQAEMKHASRDASNSHFRSRYADITSVWNAIREPLTKNGLTVMQDVTTISEGVSVETRLVHSSGQWIQFGPLVIPLSKRDAHGIGSAVSYGRRYALSSALGVVSDDDDGNEAVAYAPKIELIDQAQLLDIQARIKTCQSPKDAHANILRSCQIQELRLMTKSQYNAAIEAFDSGVIS